MDSSPDAGLRSRTRVGLASLVGLLALSGLLATGASAATISLASGTTATTFAIGGGGSGTAVSKCKNPAWGLIAGTSWIGVSSDCTIGDAASNKTTTYTVTFTLPAGFTVPSISGSAFLADNAGSVALNGTVLGAASFSSPVAFDTANAALFHVGANTLTFTVTDLGGANGLDYAATVNFTDSANLSLTKTAAPTSVLHGQNVVYTLTAANAGPGTAVAPVITDTLPAGQTLVFADAPCTTAGSPVVVTCPTADLPSGSSVTIHLTASTGGVAALTSPLVQTDTASVTSPTGDPDLTNNTATANVTVVPAADLSLVKTASPDPVIANQQLTYTLTVTNAGPDTAVNATVVDTLPAGVTFLNEGTQPPGTPTCTAAGAVVTCPLGDIPAGGTVTATIVVAVTDNPPPGSLSNTATVSSSTADSNPANNTSAITTGVTPSCTTTITGQHVGALVVHSGQFLCLTGATQTGAILVDAGGALTLTNSTVLGGGVQSNGAAFMTLCGSTLTSGSVVIKNTTLLTRVGDDAINCPGNTISGSVTLTGNKGGVEVFGNTIKGSLAVDGNLGASPFADGTPEVEGNTVGAALGCTANNPAPVNDGSANAVTGAKLGQCQTL